MRKPIFVRQLTDLERQRLENGLRSSDVFMLRRCQVLLASDRGQNAREISHNLGCSDQAARNGIRAFNERGLESLKKGSPIPHTIHAVFDTARAERLRALLPQSPRNFGRPTSVWTLKLAAEVSFETGLDPTQVSDEAVRATLLRLGVRWKRAKKWITSPDPEYARKKKLAIG